VPRKTKTATYLIRQPDAIAVPRKSSDKNTISAFNVGRDAPTKALSSNVVARKVLAITIAHTFQFLKVAIAIA
jgi:hypothetical protein